MKPISPPEDLVPLRQLAKRLQRLGISHRWLKREADAGRLPCLEAGQRRLFSVNAVEVELRRRAAGEGGGCGD